MASSSVESAKVQTDLPNIMQSLSLNAQHKDSVLSILEYVEKHKI